MSQPTTITSVQYIDLANIEITKQLTVKSDIEKTEEYQPYLIDAGGSFIDFWGDRHYDACGWLSIFAALLFDEHEGVLPPNILERWDTLSISTLKVLSKHFSNTGCIDTPNFECLCDSLQMRINEFNPSSPNYSHVYGREYKYTISLWLSAGHYTAYLPGGQGVGYREEFKNKYSVKFNLICGPPKPKPALNESLNVCPEDYVYTDQELENLINALSISAMVNQKL